MRLHDNLLGPVGNAGPSCQLNQISFNSKTWLESNNLKLTGLVFYTEEYLFGIQFLGTAFELQDGVWNCSGEYI